MLERIEVPDSASEVFEFAYSRGWTDGLPVIPATADLVDAMVECSKRAPEDLIGEIPPALGQATVEAIAVNAVMAGCKAEYISVVIGCVEGMCSPQFNLTNIQTTGDSTTPGIVLNGPIRKALDVNCGEGAAGPGWRANATIGRAIRLILINLGGSIAGKTDRAILGQPAKYTFCIGENEERSPWEPLHVSRGFSAEASVATMVPVLFTQFAWPLVVDPGTMLSSMAKAMASPSHSNAAYFDAPVTWIIPPDNAGMLCRAGFSKKQVQEYLFEHSRVPIEDFPLSDDLQMWNYSVRTQGNDVLIVDSPDDIAIIVAGGSDYSGALYLGGAEACRPVSTLIV